MVVILAAGKGTRMGREDKAKVCFEIDGIAAINRIIAAFKQKRFRKFMVVVGSLAEQVLDTVGQMHPEVSFVYQTPRLGTGHAGKIAANAIEGLGHVGPVLVTLGDKYIEPEAIDVLIDGYVRNQADLALLTVPRTKVTEASSGRVLIDKKGQAIGILERIDLARQAIADELKVRLDNGSGLTTAMIKSVAKKHIANSKKRSVAVPELLKHVAFPEVIEALATLGDSRAVKPLKKLLADGGRIIPG